MQTVRWMMCVVVVALLAGCASVKMKVDSGPIAARTFCFVPVGPRPATPLRANEEKAHILIQEAIINNLSARGLSHVAEGGDIVVAYLIIVGDGTITTCRDEYFGFESDASGLMDKVHARSLKQGGRNYTVAGTLVIDILNADTSKLLKRATIHSEILRDVAMEVRATRVQAAVDQALSDLKIIQQ
jgi:hypothetical protein